MSLGAYEADVIQKALDLLYAETGLYYGTMNRPVPDSERRVYEQATAIVANERRPRNHEERRRLDEEALEGRGQARPNAEYPPKGA